MRLHEKNAVIGNKELGQTAGEASTERSRVGNDLVAMRESNRQGARIPKNQPQSRRLQNDSESDDENAVKFVQETKTRSRKKETRKCIKLTEYDGTTPWPLFYQVI